MRWTAVVFTTAIVLSVVARHTSAQTPGSAVLHIREVGTGSTEATVEIGDILHVEAFVDTRGAGIVEVSLLLTFDDRYLQLVPAGTEQRDGETVTLPFKPGGWLDEGPVRNGTAGDRIGDSAANQVPGFQIRYEEIISLRQGGLAVYWDGVLATFDLRAVERAPADPTRIVNAGSLVGIGFTYYRVYNTSMSYGFATSEEMTVYVVDPVRALDLDADGKVDFDDFLAFAAHYGTAAGDRGFSYTYDFNHSGRIDFTDFLMLARNYGSQVPQD